MALRYICEAPSNSGVNYTVEIWDSDYSDPEIEFEIGPDLFSLRYAGENGGPLRRLVSTECSFVMFLQNADHAALVTDLAGAIENRFLVRVLRNGDLFWCGALIPDNTTVLR
jgi:hypothetical protein